VTPLAVTADSRTFKIAASFSRFGYRSIVVEGGFSVIDRDQLPFQLISLGKMPLVEEGAHISNSVRSATRFGFGTMWRSTYGAYWFPPLLLFFQWLGWYFREYLVKPLPRIPNATMYYVHSYQYYPSLCLLSKLKGAPIIYDAHDFYSGMGASGEMRLDRYISPFLKGVEWRLIKRAKAVVTVCDGVAHLMEERFGHKPTVLRNNHDSRLDRKGRMNIRDTLAVEKDAKLMVAVGNAKTAQGIEEAIEALKTLNEGVHLAFVGGGFESYRSAIYSQEVSNRLHFVGPVKPNEIVPFIAGADLSLVLYYPRSVNDRFALPNKFFQSIAAGLAVLYPDLPEISRIAKRYELGLVIDPKDPQTINSAVKSLMNDSGLLGRLKANASHAAEDLSWEQEEKILLSLVKRLIGSGNEMNPWFSKKKNLIEL
jgi:glycosyltransferase involved in cell wall biosynthesis